MTTKDAISYVKDLVRNYKGFRKQVFDFEWLLFENEADFKASKPAASLYVEFRSPPSAPEPGQPKRKSKGTAQ